eukprot:gene1473-2099_t
MERDDGQDGSDTETAISEDRSLDVEAENRRLKKQILEQDDKFKQLHARLARTEEAAKRAILNDAGGAGAPNRATRGGGGHTARLFAAEQRVQELEEQVRIQTRKLQAEHEKTLHFKNLAKVHEQLLFMQQQMFALQQENEALRANSPSRADNAAPPKQSQAEVQDLQQQVKLLKAMNRELQLNYRPPVPEGGQHSNPRSAPAPQPAASVQPGDLVWELEEFPFQGKSYLLDPATSYLYDDLTSDRWPVPVGQLVGGQPQFSVDTKDFFAALDAHLKQNSTRLKDLFEQYDADSSGALDRAELSKLMQTLMPQITQTSIQYFQAMLDVDGDGEVTYSELVHAIKECLSAGTAAKAEGDMETTEVLTKLSQYIKGDRETALRVFHAFDKNGSGKLSSAELAQLVLKVLPGVTKQQVRLVLAHMKRLDLSGDGLLSFPEFCKALKGLKIKRRAARPQAQAAPPSPAAHSRQPGGEEWVLEEYALDGKTYLLDPATAYLYEDLRKVQWPVPVGRVVQGQAQLTFDTKDFFAALDAHLKQNSTRLKDLFEQYDADSSGALDRAELSKLMQTL